MDIHTRAMTVSVPMSFCRKLEHLLGKLCDSEQFAQRVIDNKEGPKGDMLGFTYKADAYMKRAFDLNEQVQGLIDNAVGVDA